MWMMLFGPRPRPWLNDPAPEEAPPSDPRPVEPAIPPRVEARRVSHAKSGEGEGEKVSLADVILGRHFRPRI